LIVAVTTEALETARGLAGAERRIWVLGGADVYAEAMPLASHLYLTEVRSQCR
jgi:dihydrofolate reductase